MAHHRHKTNRRSFTPRKRRLLQNLASGRFSSNYKAAIAAGYAPGATAKNASSRVLKEMRQNFPEVLDRMGLSNEALVRQHLIPALNAEEIRLAQWNGKFTDSAKVPDWNTRIAALDMTFKVTGAYDDAKQEQRTPPVINVRVVNVAGGPVPRFIPIPPPVATDRELPSAESGPPTPPKKVPPR